METTRNLTSNSTVVRNLLRKGKWEEHHEKPERRYKGREELRKEGDISHWGVY